MLGLPSWLWYIIAFAFCVLVVVLTVLLGRSCVVACDVLYPDKHPSPLPGPLIQRSAPLVRQCGWVCDARTIKIEPVSSATHHILDGVLLDQICSQKGFGLQKRSTWAWREPNETKAKHFIVLVWSGGGGTEKE